MEPVKILFSFYSDTLDQWMSETMWAEIVNEEKGWYKIDNIPFYAPLIACADVVHAEYVEEEQMLVYRETVERSGNSTVWVIVTDKSQDKEVLRDALRDLGCASEGVNDRYFAVEIPAEVDYGPVRKKCRMGE